MLYVCSALFWGSPVEAEFVVPLDPESSRAARMPDVRSAAILIRPHPARMDEWKTIDLSRFENVALYGSNPMDASSQEDYFESLFYSRAVVGLNTSAFLEAAIVDRPVHTILTPEFADNQEGTLHFHYLLKVGGGVLQTSTTFEEHHAQLGRVAAPIADDAPGANPQFVREFIRPRGLETPATPVFCDAVDELAEAAGAAARAHAACACCCCGGPPIRCSWCSGALYGDRALSRRLAPHRSASTSGASSCASGAAGAPPGGEETKRERERRRAANDETREAAGRGGRGRARGPPSADKAHGGQPRCRTRRRRARTTERRGGAPALGSAQRSRERLARRAATPAAADD